MLDQSPRTNAIKWNRSHAVGAFHSSSHFSASGCKEKLLFTELNILNQNLNKELKSSCLPFSLQKEDLQCFNQKKRVWKQNSFCGAFLLENPQYFVHNILTVYFVKRCYIIKNKTIFILIWEPGNKTFEKERAAIAASIFLNTGFFWNLSCGQEIPATIISTLSPFRVTPNPGLQGLFNTQVSHCWLEQCLPSWQRQSTSFVSVPSLIVWNPNSSVQEQH